MKDAHHWYDSLKKPSWAPEAGVFSKVWAVLYFIIFAVNVYVLVLYTQHKISLGIAMLFWLNIVFNVLYSPLQFKAKHNGLASLDVLLVLATIILGSIAIWPVAPIVSIWFLPYLAWVVYATVLQLHITFKN